MVCEEFKIKSFTFYHLKKQKGQASCPHHVTGQPGEDISREDEVENWQVCKPGVQVLQTGACCWHPCERNWHTGCRSMLCSGRNQPSITKHSRQIPKIRNRRKIIDGKYVILIFKKGDRYLPSNYPPISLKSVVGTFLKEIVVDKIQTHLEKYILMIHRGDLVIFLLLFFICFWNERQWWKVHYLPWLQ